jgi:hypothetical protein
MRRSTVLRLPLELAFPAKAFGYSMKSTPSPLPSMPFGRKTFCRVTFCRLVNQSTVELTIAVSTKMSVDEMTCGLHYKEWDH